MRETLFSALFGPRRPLVVAWVRPGHFMLVDRDESRIPHAPNLPPSRTIYWDYVPFVLGLLLSIFLGELPQQGDYLKLRREEVPAPDTKSPFVR